MSRACPVCGGEALQSLTAAVGERLYCQVCFHGWRPEVPVYSYSTMAMCSLGTSQERLETQIRFFAPYVPCGGDILEIGCATGELAAATQTLLNVGRYDGIELSPAGETARRRISQLYTEPLRTLQDKGAIAGRYDLILMSHVLEHIADVRGEVAAMKRQLKPGGAIFLKVPNGAGHRRLPIDDNKSHLHFFSVVSLARLLATEGLETISAATDVRLDARYADSLQVITRPFALPHWKAGFLSDHPLLAGKDQIVVWGAGSIADEVLANFFDPARIDFFIDKNPEKQGATLLGRPVKGPQALGDAPRTILLNSIDFSPAIARDITVMHPGVAHVLIPIGDLL
jgi:2-polyprenyl-3-methyl-5-hydroxy-6-metoxy-1,4-benzoquinol methylase